MLHINWFFFFFIIKRQLHLTCTLKLFHPFLHRKNHFKYDQVFSFFKNFRAVIAKLCLATDWIKTREIAEEIIVTAVDRCML